MELSYFLECETMNEMGQIGKTAICEPDSKFTYDFRDKECPKYCIFDSKYCIIDH